MTTGSWSNQVTTNAPSTVCGGGILVNGTSVSWSGADAPAGSRPYRGTKPALVKQRDVLYVVDPLSQPYSRGRFKLRVPRNIDLTSQEWKDQSIFDVARSRRIREIEPYSPLEDTGEHAFSKTWDTRRNSVFLAYNLAQRVTYQRALAPCGYSPRAISSPWTTAHDYKLIERLRRKVVGSDFNLANAIGAEGRETVKFILDTATRIAKSAMYMKKVRPDLALRTLREWGRVPTVHRANREVRHQLDVYKDLLPAVFDKRKHDPWLSIPAKQWLEYHLAVEPLVGDVKAAAEALAHNHLDRPVGKTLRASVKVSNQPSTFSGGWSRFDVQHRTVRKSVVAHFVSEPTALSLSGIYDPEVVVWEALPLSFVFDYMFDVGSYLQARASRSAFGKGLFVFSTKDWFENIGWNAWMVGNTQVELAYDGTGKYQQVSGGTFVRTVQSSLPVPPPQWKPFGAFQSWQRMLTVLSLGAVIGPKVAR